jgi:hypothetical protein
MFHKRAKHSAVPAAVRVQVPGPARVSTPMQLEIPNPGSLHTEADRTRTTTVPHSVIVQQQDARRDGISLCKRFCDNEISLIRTP